MSDHDANGDFAKGNRAGSGRPKGARNRITLSMKAMRDEHADAVWRGALAAAVGGNVRAIELVLKPYLRQLNRPDVKRRKIETTAHVIAAHAELHEAVTAGRLTIEEAEGLGAIVDRVGKAIDTAALMSLMQSELAALRQELEEVRNATRKDPQ